MISAFVRAMVRHPAAVRAAPETRLVASTDCAVGESCFAASCGAFHHPPSMGVCATRLVSCLSSVSSLRWCGSASPFVTAVRRDARRRYAIADRAEDLIFQTHLTGLVRSVVQVTVLRVAVLLAALVRGRRTVAAYAVRDTAPAFGVEAVCMVSLMRMVHGVLVSLAIAFFVRVLIMRLWLR